MATQTPGASKSHQNVFSWSISPEELKYQVDNYKKLSFTESYRGIAALLVLLSFGLTTIAWGFGLIPFETWIGDVILYLPVAFFVYKGHRWAVVLLMLLWTADKGYQMFETPGVMIIFWWIFFMPYFYKALRIENERRKNKTAVIEKGSIYCTHCGAKQDSVANFCTACGEKI